MDYSRTIYQRAFEAYLRWGTPVWLTLKQSQPSNQYVWLTQLDDRVRTSHAAHHGQIFSWAAPPPTGHPGEDFGCRCVAVPYGPDLPEDLAIELQDVSDTGAQWTSLDFIDHYFSGAGAPVTLRETGHLEAVVSKYRRLVIDDPTVLPSQIANEARVRLGQSLQKAFDRSYDMTDLVFSLGNTTIGGVFRGSSHAIGGMLYLAGAIDFHLRDSFRDPLDIGAILTDPFATPGESIGAFEQQLREYLLNLLRQQAYNQRMSVAVPSRKDLRELPGGTPYDISDKWSGMFSGRVFLDGSKSRYA